MVSRKFMFKMMVKALLTAFLSYISFSPLFFSMSSCSIVQGNGQLADICPMLVLAPIPLGPFIENFQQKVPCIKQLKYLEKETFLINAKL